MLEKIPEFNQGHKPSHQNNAGVDLAPVVFNPSLLLCRLEIAVYLFMLVSASAAIFPFLLAAFYWPLLWLVFALMLGVGIRSSLRAKKSPSIVLSVTQKVWRIQTSEGDIVVKPCDDILVWAAMIILPVQEVATGRKRRLIALPDSMLPEDWRRLRVWLRMALHNSN